MGFLRTDICLLDVYFDPQKMAGPSMKKIVSEEAAFEKTLILTGQLFSSLSPRFFYYLTLLRKNRRPVLIDIIFNVHWGILGAIVSLKLIPSFGFKSIFVPKS